MQGRLSKSINNKIQSFPIYSWTEEFKKASDCGFEIMEWVFDEYEKNPIIYSEEISKIESLCNNNNITINSICADYFMKKKLFSESQENLEKNIMIMNNLILQSQKLGISYIELPFVDSSSLKTEQNKNELKKSLEKILPLTEKHGVSLVLETDLPPIEFKSLLLDLNHPNILANYDSGNSTSLGYNMKEELIILKKWIANVHVKDREYQGGTVPLGTGDTDFDLFFSSLPKIHYSGDLIIQGARISDDAISLETTCTNYREFVKRYVDKYYK